MRGAGGGTQGLAAQTPYGVQRPIAYTPTVTWAGNTITTQSGFYLKTPGKLEIWVSFIETVGTVTTSLSITTPTGYVASTHTGSLAIGVGMIARAAGVAASSTGMLSAAAGTLTVVTNASIAGVVDTWIAYASIPTTT